MAKEERAERLTHRIESFSDLVIGFSLALLALTLSIPAHIIDLWRHPWWLIAYFWTFAVIARLWYMHQRLFTRLFWPDSLSVFLNFLLLSLIGLLVYFVQVFVHYNDSFERAWAFIAYFTVLGLLFIVSGILHQRGVRSRWESLDAADRYFGVEQAVRSIAAGTLLVAGAVAAALLPAHSLQDIWPIPIAVFIALLGARIALNRIRPRIAGTPTEI